MRILVTAGPTREFIDPIRFISNRSSGKMGYAVAGACARRGHEVVLVSGPAALDVPSGVQFVPVVSANDMLEAVVDEFGKSDCLVMAAAVADWRPAEVAGGKLKKGASSLALRLEPTTDILAELAKTKKAQIMAGFAAETGDPRQEARRKLESKSLDVIFANDVSCSDSGFVVDSNRILCLKADGTEEEWPLLSKADAGGRIADVLEGIYAERVH